MVFETCSTVLATCIAAIQPRKPTCWPKCFDNDGLILCEIIDRGILDKLPRKTWQRSSRGSHLIVSFATAIASCSRSARPGRRRIEDVEHAVLSEERSEGLAISEGHNPNFYGAARARGAKVRQ